MENKKIDSYDASIIACAILNANEDLDQDVIEDMLYDTFGIYFDDFKDLINALTPLVRSSISKSDNILTCGFIHPNPPHTFIYSINTPNLYK